MTFNRKTRFYFTGYTGIWNIVVVLLLFHNSKGEVTYDQTLTATPSAAYFTSPGYPTAYSNNLTYEWLIESQTVDEVVKISVLDCEIEYVNAKIPACQFDFLTIYDGAFDNMTVLYDSCCMTSVPDLNSTSQYLLIKFVTDSTVVAKGFRIKYYNTGTITTDSVTTASAGIFIVVIIVVVLVVLGLFVAIFLIYKITAKNNSSPLRVNPVGGEENRVDQDGGHRPINAPIDEYTKQPLGFSSGSPVPPPEVWVEPCGSENHNSPKKTNLFNLKLPDKNTRGIQLPPVEHPN